MSEIASNFTADPEIKAELEFMLKEKEIEGRIGYLKEQKGLDVSYIWDPPKMHVTFLIKSKDGKMFKAMANSKKMALTQCYAGYLDKVK
tara:strand:+ start:2401 stop:2667 length:267 start_codon:yes stop_codon:yes gene_type:complete